jgi:hypothetical protein
MRVLPKTGRYKHSYSSTFSISLFIVVEDRRGSLALKILHTISAGRRKKKIVRG